MAEESIYGSDRVEQSIDTSDDIFDDVFGADDEKKAAKKKLEEKAKELEEKIKKKENVSSEEKNDNADNEDEDELIEGEEGSTEPELFIDAKMSNEEKKDFEKKARKVKALTNDDRLQKKKTDFQEQIDNGLEKSLKGKGKSGKPIDEELVKQKKET